MKWSDLFIELLDFPLLVWERGHEFLDFIEGLRFDVDGPYGYSNMLLDESNSQGYLFVILGTFIKIFIFEEPCLEWMAFENVY